MLDKKKTKESKLDPKWGEGFFLGTRWRPGEFIIGTASGILKASSVRRVGGRRRWDGAGLQEVRGWPGNGIQMNQDLEKKPVYACSDQINLEFQRNLKMKKVEECIVSD